LAEAAEKLSASIEQLIFADGYVYVDGCKSDLALKEVIACCRAKGKLTLGHGWFNPDTTGLDPETGYGSPFGTYAFATQVVEVEVDTATGKVEVLKVVAAHDVGRAVNPDMVVGQIEGGTVMGLGYATLEELEVNQGKIKNPNFDAYLMATTLDVPEIISVIVEDNEPTGPFGAKGVGEPALIPTAAAIANAVYDAIGVRIFSLPITPERVLAALDEKNAR